MKQVESPASVHAHASSRSQERRLTWLAYSCIFVEGINAGWIGPFLPEISELVHVSIDNAGLIVSATAAGYLAALLAAGETAHRWSAQNTLTASMLLVSAGLFGLSFAPAMPALLCAAFVAGLGYGAVDVASNAMVVDLNRHRLAAALNYLHVMFGVGALIGPIISGFALSNHLRYSVMFGVGAAFSAVIAILLATTRGIETHIVVARGDGFISMLKHPLIWVLGAVLFLYVGAETGIGA